MTMQCTPAIFLNSLSQVSQSLTAWERQSGYDHPIIIVDAQTEQVCLPRLLSATGEYHHLSDAPVITLPQGEEAKSVDTSIMVWTQLSRLGATRHSYLIAIGGGAVTDAVGWIASTYMRGIGLVHIPTTLLGAIDAAIGGKTAIDLHGVKNIVGAFYPAHLTLISTHFFDTLPTSEVLSGYGEVIKYGLLLGSPLLAGILLSDPRRMITSDEMSDVVNECVKYKEKVVADDPYDRGIRKFLNLGHTVGHAIEGYRRLVGTPVPHGVAVAAGLVAELYLSVKLRNFPRDIFYAVIGYIKTYFPAIPIDCDDYEGILALAHQDKKNRSQGQISVILMTAPEAMEVADDITDELFEEALDFYRDYIGV